MESYKRRSPVKFSARPLNTQMRNGWEVVLNYSDENDGPFLIDLSHIEKWDVQGENLTQISPAGISVPQHSKQCRFHDGVLLSVVKWNWANIWCFYENGSDFSDEPAYTDVTEAYALFALIGKDVFSVLEKITALDLANPYQETPFLVLGPVLHVRSQVVVLEKDEDNPAVLIACHRGYGQSMAQALLEEGSEYGLKPGGENVFTEWVRTAAGVLEKA